MSEVKNLRKSNQIRYVFAGFIIIVMTATLCAADFRPGISYLAGVRYDDLRMCVATKAGVKGGPIADGSAVLSWNTEDMSWGAKIPVIRPILFGAAFQMLQFEPEMFFSKTLGKEKKFSLMPGIGFSAHYGPDYNASLKKRGDEFWAFGPIISLTSGFRLPSNNDKRDRIIGIRPFYTPLFARDGRTGTVLGCSVDFWIKY